MFALLIRHEIDRIERFPTSNKLCPYAGLVSSTNSSGGKTYHGRIKQGNRHLRRVLIEAVIPTTRKDAQIRSSYYFIKAKKGSNPAKVTKARRLLKIAYQVWKENRFYRTKTSRTALFTS